MHQGGSKVYHNEFLKNINKSNNKYALQIKNLAGGRRSWSDVLIVKKEND